MILMTCIPLSFVAFDLKALLPKVV